MSIRGGNWNNQSHAGVFNLNLNNLRSNTNTNIGFRLDFGLARRYYLTGGYPVHTIGRLCPASPSADKYKTVRGVLVAEKRKIALRLTDNMRRHGNLFEHIYDLENLEQAWRKVRLGKRYKSEVLSFSYNLFENLIGVQNDLIWKTYKIGNYRQFTIYDPKERIIEFLPVRDRVVLQALHSVINPIFDRGFACDSYACRKGKGTHAALYRLQHFIRLANNRWGHNIHYLQGDIFKYFPNIDHDVLKERIRRKIKCTETLWLIDHIIESSPNKPGLPIGLLFSQLAANIYMDALDQFVKHELREKYYIRYMDDFIILGSNKADLKNVLDKIEDFLGYHLHLKLNRKTDIQKIVHGIDFVGYRVWPDKVKIRKSSVKRQVQRLKRFKHLYSCGQISLPEIRQSIMSWVAHCKHADTYRLREKVLGGVVLKKGNK